MTRRSTWLLALLMLPAAVDGAAALEEVLVVYEGDAPPLLAGVTLVHAYQNVPVLQVQATLARVLALEDEPGVLGVYPIEPLESHLDLARVAHGVTVESGVTERGRGVGIAVIDTGIDALHPAFQDRLTNYVVSSRGVDERALPVEDDSHGTHVAGIMAGDGARSPQSRYRGMAPSALLFGLDISEEFNTANALRAFDWVIDNHDRLGIHVVSNSWGRQGDVDGMYDPNAPLVKGTSRLVDEGLIVVFSAGNRGGTSNMDTEALNPEALTVGATDVGGRLRAFSSKGPPLTDDGLPGAWTKPDLVAVGEEVVSARGGISTGPLDFGDRSLAPLDYRTDRGTSMAAAMVTGAVALLLEADPALTPDEVAAILRGTARDVGPAGIENETGWGFIDVPLAIETARSNMLLPGDHDRVAQVRYDFTVSHALGVPVRVLPTPGIASGTGFAVKVPVTQGAETLRTDVEWTGSLGASFTVRATSPSGQRFPFSGSGDLRSLDVSLPEPGMWTVHMTPGNGIWQTELTIIGTIEAAHRVTQPFTVRELVEESGPPPEAVPRAAEQTPAPGSVILLVLAGLALLLGRRKH